MHPFGSAPDRYKTKFSVLQGACVVGVCVGSAPDRYKTKFSVLQGACVVGELWRLHLTFYKINLKMPVKCMIYNVNTKIDYLVNSLVHQYRVFLIYW